MFTPLPPEGLREPDATPAQTRSPRRLRNINPLIPYLYVLPALVLVGVWIYAPLIQTVNLSFYDWNMLPTSPSTHVGLGNYTEVINLPEMRAAVANTGLYVLAGITFLVLLPTAAVLVVRRLGRRASNAYQALVFLPYLMTPVATGALWRWLFAEQTGLITQWAAAAGIELGNVFRDPSTSLWAIVVILGWQMIGFGVLMVSAGYTGIDPLYSEAAAIDGASERRITWTIVLPLLSPTLAFLGLMAVLLVAQWSFPLIDLLTKGGPGSSSTNVYHLLYVFGFQNFDAGISSAAGVLFFIAFSLIALFFVELSERLSFFDD
ncbi:sugar ABC transporter permease [Pseudarthrobacter sulfonivorans]|uniref:carbohydrate ABC transporter permease n=1 Tax=Pseudarthrobacter sulfonivorans TaxID=121292 RepID=UPI002854BD56|nr:sugar ABC transporter permease [Pseudarthrobacter sulfonivorans]MDR6417487.1 multiple sugar transport system permease protein [Pseudarthrobacter sulfonivorans]